MVWCAGMFVALGVFAWGIVEERKGYLAFVGAIFMLACAYGIAYSYLRLRFVRCPECGERCLEKKDPMTGEIYLVCTSCQVKRDTGIRNSND